MRIDTELCVKCGSCEVLCPAGAISLQEEVMIVSQKKCCDCGLCLREAGCPNKALVQSEESGEYPRLLRAQFSNPHVTHRTTSVPGRGTEESKTNDVTGRVGRGEVSILVEMGRPMLGCSFRDIQIVSVSLKREGFDILGNNPLRSLMESESGRFPEQLLDQRITSAILEVHLPEARLEEVFELLFSVADQIDTVFSVSVLSLFDEYGNLPVVDRLESLGINTRPNGKINLGLGRLPAGAEG